MNPNKLPRLVVCAANRYTMTLDDGGEEYFIIAGVRHYDQIMRQQINALADGNYWSKRTKEEQGFLDNRGEFLSREEALRIARLEDQVRRKVGGDENKLFSENLF